MMENIHWSFEKLVSELNWMDDRTKKKTLHKARQMKTLVGYPNFIKDPKLLDEYYENVFNTLFIIHAIPLTFNDNCLV